MTIFFINSYMVFFMIIKLLRSNSRVLAANWSFDIKSCSIRILCSIGFVIRIILFYSLEAVFCCYRKSRAIFASFGSFRNPTFSDIPAFCAVSYVWLIWCLTTENVNGNLVLCYILRDQANLMHFQMSFLSSPESKLSSSSCCSSSAQYTLSSQSIFTCSSNFT